MYHFLAFLPRLLDEFVVKVLSDANVYMLVVQISYPLPSTLPLYPEVGGSSLQEAAAGLV